MHAIQLYYAHGDKYFTRLVAKYRTAMLKGYCAGRTYLFHLVTAAAWISLYQDLTSHVAYHYSATPQSSTL